MNNILDGISHHLRAKRICPGSPPESPKLCAHPVSNYPGSQIGGITNSVGQIGSDGE
jgi:hypothetical protein